MDSEPRPRRRVCACALGTWGELGPEVGLKGLRPLSRRGLGLGVPAVLMRVSLLPGVVPTQDVLSMLGDIRRSLEEVRVQGWIPELLPTRSCSTALGTRGLPRTGEPSWADPHQARGAGGAWGPGERVGVRKGLAGEGPGGLNGKTAQTPPSAWRRGLTGSGNHENVLEACVCHRRYQPSAPKWSAATAPPAGDLG